VPGTSSSRPDGTRQQDPRRWTAALVSTGAKRSKTAQGVEVVEIGVSGQQHVPIVLDRGDEPFRWALP
jgi:sugar (pentulose or hexulose) kinase